MHGSRAYQVEIWRPQENKRKTAKVEWELFETKIPLRLGKPLPLIPFVFHGPRHSRPDVDRPPLSDIIAVNLDHYRLDADYKHGLHFTALPTAWVSGFDKSASLRIGSSTAWVSETPGATAGYLEFTGQGLTSFEVGAKCSRGRPESRYLVSYNEVCRRDLATEGRRSQREPPYLAEKN